MVDAGTVDDAPVMRTGGDRLSRFQTMKGHYFAASDYLNTHLSLPSLYISFNSNINSSPRHDNKIVFQYGSHASISFDQNLSWE